MKSSVVVPPIRVAVSALAFVTGLAVTGILVVGCTDVPNSILASLVDAGNANPTGGDETIPGDVSEPNSNGDDVVVPTGDGDDSGASDDDGGDSSIDDGNEPVPPVDYCTPTIDWPEAYAAFEDEVLTLVNEQRAAGADCGEAGSFDPVAPLTMHASLRCAARVHSLDMADRNYFSHTNPEGEGPRDRTTDAGYEGSTWGENIALGYPTPEAVISGWMNSPGHCANIMRASFSEIGIGYFDGNYWTQNFGAP